MKVLEILPLELSLRNSLNLSNDEYIILYVIFFMQKHNPSEKWKMRGLARTAGVPFSSLTMSLLHLSQKGHLDFSENGTLIVSFGIEQKFNSLIKPQFSTNKN